MSEDKDLIFDESAPVEQVAYTDDNIRHLSDMEHIRTRPGL